MNEPRARRARVVAMRSAGLLFREIADELGISPGRAAALYHQGIADPRPAVPLEEVTSATAIEDLPIGRRARETLTRYGVPLADLIERDRAALEVDLLQLQNCNRRALIEIVAVLDACARAAGS